MVPTERSLERLPIEGGVAFSFAGPGFHTGLGNRLRFSRAAPGKTLVVVEGRGIDPTAGEVADTTLRCSRVGGVGPLEHLAAAVAILGVDGWVLEADHPDLPLFDGSALVWREAILATGQVGGPRLVAGPTRVLEVSDARGRIRLEPSDDLELEVHWSGGPEGEEIWRGGADELSELLQARTFVTAHEYLQAAELGMLAGASLESGRLLRGNLVEGPELDFANRLGVDSRFSVWSGGAARMPSECAAHKALDLIGDLCLCVGAIPRGKILAVNAGHSLHHLWGQGLSRSA